MDLSALAANLLKLVVTILYIIAVIFLLPAGNELLKSIRGGQKKVAQMEENDAPTGEVFKRAGRSFSVVLMEFVFVGLIVILPLVIASPQGVGSFVATTLNYFLALIGITFQFPVPGAYLIQHLMFI